MFKDEILENARRRKIYKVILENPGLHIRQLQRIVGIPLTSLQHHLNYMSRRNIVLEEKSEHYTRYYSKLLDSEDKKILLLLRQKTARQIVMMILVNKKAKYRSIVQASGLPSSTISFHLKQLLDNQVVERTKIGYENIYTLKDEDKITKVLVAYQPSFLDKMVDKWTSTWLENQFGKAKSKEKEPE